MWWKWASINMELKGMKGEVCHFGTSMMLRISRWFLLQVSDALVSDLFFNISLWDFSFFYHIVYTPREVNVP